MREINFRGNSSEGCRDVLEGTWIMTTEYTIGAHCKVPVPKVHTMPNLTESEVESAALSSLRRHPFAQAHLRRTADRRR